MAAIFTPVIGEIAMGRRGSIFLLDPVDDLLLLPQRVLRIYPSWVKNRMSITTLSQRISSIRLIGSNAIPEGLLPPIEMEEYDLAALSEIPLLLTSTPTGITAIPTPQYPAWIEANGLYSQYGSFIDYALRRIIERCSGALIRDYRAEGVIAGNIKRGSISDLVEVRETIRNAYERHKKTSLSTRNTLKDTWVVSLAHSLWYTGYKKEHWDKLSTLQLDDAELDVLTERLKSMVRGMSNILRGTSPSQSSADPSTGTLPTGTEVPHEDVQKVLCNPSMYIPGVMVADGDLIIGDCVIDFKCSKRDCVTSGNFIQVMSYAALMRRQHSSPICRVAFLNPISGLFYLQDISSWQKHGELITFLTQTMKLPADYTTTK